jgi:hypothetical protein
MSNLNSRILYALEESIGQTVANMVRDGEGQTDHGRFLFEP